MSKQAFKSPKPTAKDKLLDAAFALIRTQGYSSTTLDELCTHAGVTKGSFFHYFENKEDLAVKAAEHWSLVTGNFFASAPYHKLEDPLDRLLGYIEFRRQIISGNVPEFTCLVGTMVQEAFEVHPKIRQACHDSIFGHAETLEGDIREAIKLYPPQGKFTAKSLALHTQAVLQGAFILTKASGNSAQATDSLDHLKLYIQLLFNNQPKMEQEL
jgi:TetR/AcrR family transcriptional regulator, transcriptional repressor for nem operon